MDAQRLRRAFAPLAAAGLVGLVAFAGAPAVRAADEVAFTVGNPTLAAPLGMATDHVNKRYWTIQNSSGTLAVQALDAEGVRLGSASSRDRITNVQALAATNQLLFIGDVGGSRERVAIFRMDRPLPGTEINRSATIALAYPDGAHDAAAIMVNASERLFVVTRGKNAGIYAAPEEPQVLLPWITTPAPVNRLTRVADAPADVSDATILVDGRIALRTVAGGVQLLDGATYAELGSQPIEAPQRGGSITQSLDQQVLLAGAGTDGSVVKVAVPGPPPAKPTAVSTKRPADKPTEATAPEENRAFEQTGTMVALVAAAAVSLLAAGIVLVKR